MMWNRAAVGLMNLRQQSCGGQSDAGLGVQSLQSLHPILRAQLLTESGSFAEALALFETHLNEALTQGLNSVASALLADQAWCRLQLSERDSAMADARAAQAHLHQSLTCGDRAPAHSRLAQVFDALQRQTEATRHQQMADVAWQGHADDQAQLLEALAPLTPYGAA